LIPIFNRSKGITCKSERIKIGATTMNIIKSAEAYLKSFNYSFKFRNVIDLVVKSEYHGIILQNFWITKSIR